MVSWTVKLRHNTTEMLCSKQSELSSGCWIMRLSGSRFQKINFDQFSCCCWRQTLLWGTISSWNNTSATYERKKTNWKHQTRSISARGDDYFRLLGKDSVLWCCCKWIKNSPAALAIKTLPSLLFEPLDGWVLAALHVEDMVAELNYLTHVQFSST